MKMLYVILGIVIIVALFGGIFLFKAPVKEEEPEDTSTEEPPEEEFSIESVASDLNKSVQASLDTLMGGSTYIVMYSLSKNGSFFNLASRTLSEFESSFLVATTVYNKPYEGKKPSTLLLKSDCECVLNCGYPSEIKPGWLAYDLGNQDYELVLFNCSNLKGAENPRAHMVIGAYYLDENDERLYTYAKALSSFYSE
jgi:hypothetical protein